MGSRIGGLVEVGRIPHNVTPVVNASDRRIRGKLEKHNLFASHVSGDTVGQVGISVINGRDLPCFIDEGVRMGPVAIESTDRAVVIDAVGIDKPRARNGPFGDPFIVHDKTVRVVVLVQVVAPGISIL